MNHAGELVDTSWEARYLITGLSQSNQRNLAGNACSRIDSRFDSSRFILEHYVDGDLLNASEPPNMILGSPDNLHVWGELLFSLIIALAPRLFLNKLMLMKTAGPDLPPTFMQ